MVWIVVLFLVGCRTPGVFLQKPEQSQVMVTKKTKIDFRDRPHYFLTQEEIREFYELMSRSDLNALQSKRLLDLAQTQLKELKSTSSRYVELKNLVDTLKPKVSELMQEIQGLRDQNRRGKEIRLYEEPAILIQNSRLKKLYQEVLRLWNVDQLDKAIQKIKEIVDNSSLMKELSQEEKIKVFNLKFRIALELKDFAQANEAYSMLYQVEKCHEDTMTAGVLLAITYWVYRESNLSLKVLENQCQEHRNPFHRVRFHYWKGRVLMTQGVTPREAFRSVTQTKLPGYYAYLAKSWMKERLNFSPEAFGSAMFLHVLPEVPLEVKNLIEKAKTMLSYRLYSEATVYLVRASQVLRDLSGASSLRALIFIGHLFQQAQHPLEAMRIYAYVTQRLQEDETLIHDFPIDFLMDMFPKPFIHWVESYSHEHGLDPDFVFALMRQESAFQPGAVSIANARGVLQILPSVAREVARQAGYPFFKERLLFFASENLKLAMNHLAILKNRVEHPFFIAASYNAGFERLAKWRQRYADYPLDAFVEMIPVHETRNYIKLVVRNYIHYKAQRNGGWIDPNIFPIFDPSLPMSRAASSSFYFVF